MTPAAVLRAVGLHRSYGRRGARVRAVRNVSLDLQPGELVVLRGASGSGKTTLLNLLGGLDAPTRGEVWVRGRSLTAADESEQVELRRRELGFIFQTFALLPELSARENIDLPLRLAGAAFVDRERRVDELLEAVGLADHGAQRPAELSGGQQQRLGIARALANRPSVVIADEPTGQLDSRNAEAMMRLLAGLVHQDGIAAIVSTHDPRMAAHADRILSLRDGMLVA
jgi:putative ABC transport system ATP-binding protein